MDMLNKFKDYINNIKPNDKIALVYHGFCGDGVCSAVITVKALERIINKKSDLIIHQDRIEFNSEDIKNLKNNKITHAIFVDLSLNKSINELREVSKSIKILIIDHHDFKEDFSSENLL